MQEDIKKAKDLLDIAVFFGDNQEIYPEYQIYQTMLGKIAAAMLHISCDAAIDETEGGSDCGCSTDKPLTDKERETPVSLDLPMINIDDTIARIQNELNPTEGGSITGSESSCLVS